MQNGPLQPNNQPYGAPTLPPLPIQPAQPIQPTTPNTSKPKTGLIIGIIVSIIVLIGIIVGVVLVLNNKPENKSDERPTDNTATSNTPDESNEDKFSTITVGYKGKSFTVSSSFGDTAESASSSFEISHRNDNYRFEKITDLDAYLGIESDERLDHRARVYVFDEKDGYENYVIEIEGGLAPKKQGKITPFSNYDLVSVHLESYIGPVTYSIEGYQFTTQVTTKSEIIEHFGKPDYDNEQSTYELATYEQNGFTIIVHYDITDSGYIVNSVYISTGLFRSE